MSFIHVKEEWHGDFDRDESFREAFLALTAPVVGPLRRAWGHRDAWDLGPGLYFSSELVVVFSVVLKKLLICDSHKTLLLVTDLFSWKRELSWS